MKRLLLTLLKIGIPLTIIAWLLTTIEPERLEQLRERDKNWGLLGLAFALALTAVCLTFVRWYLLVRALELRFRLADAFRLGSLAYLLNFVSAGSVGGDLFKAFFIAREQPGRRAEAVATVVVDRLIGLYALLLVTATVVLIVRLPESAPAVQAIGTVTLAAAGIGGLAILAILTPGFTSGSLSELLVGLPRVGPTLEQLILSLRMYRSRRLAMGSIFVMSLAVHGLLTVAIFLIATALFSQTPTLAEHFIIVPMANVVGALPLTPAGLGSFEFAMDELYQRVPAGGAGEVVGVLVALAFRLVTIVIAGVGVIYYWTCRRDVQQVLQAERTASPHAEMPASTHARDENAEASGEPPGENANSQDAKSHGSAAERYVGDSW